MFKNPQHPYTQALLSAIAIPSLVQKHNRIKLRGEITSPINPAPYCRFASRCMYAQENCFKDYPNLEITDNHTCACFHKNNLIETIIN